MTIKEQVLNALKEQPASLNELYAKIGAKKTSIRVILNLLCRGENAPVKKVERGVYALNDVENKGAL